MHCTLRSPAVASRPPRLGLLLVLAALAACGGGGGGGGTPAPVADFTASVTSGAAPLTVQFTDESTNAPTSWQWDFDGDGATDATQPNPSWTYATSGSFSVRLVATNSGGSGTTTRANYVTVSLSPNAALGMVAIAPGAFVMGDDTTISSEAPAHTVELTRPFWMGAREVTQAAYEAVMGTNPSTFQGSGQPNAPQLPVENVSWYDAVDYCQRLTAIERAAQRVPVGYEYRLPTEAEWEYCCRAGTTTRWNTGATLTSAQANFVGVGQTAVVASYPANAFGLHDMHGNVWEWCLDAFRSYPAEAESDPYFRSSGTCCFRGGSWMSNLPTEATSTRRINQTQTLRSDAVGFRIVLAPTILVPGAAQRLVGIRPGAFAMGSNAGPVSEQPVHTVTLSQPFWLGKFEVRQIDYAVAMGANPSYFEGVDEAFRPVERVTWAEARAYCAAVTAAEQAAGRIPAGYEYRLPTEAEWEYCCRAGTTTEWHTGASLTTAQANFGGASSPLATSQYPNGQTAAVGSYAANAFGLHDMHGNASEWCLDSSAAYASGAVTDPFVTGGVERVVRGGSWFNPTSSTCRSAFRAPIVPTFASELIGFRVVLGPALAP